MFWLHLWYLNFSDPTIYVAQTVPGPVVFPSIDKRTFGFMYSAMNGTVISEATLCLVTLTTTRCFIY